jgi:hypothetical protein
LPNRGWVIAWLAKRGDERVIAWRGDDGKITSLPLPDELKTQWEAQMDDRLGRLGIWKVADKRSRDYLYDLARSNGLAWQVREDTSPLQDGETIIEIGDGEAYFYRGDINLIKAIIAAVEELAVSGANTICSCGNRSHWLDAPAQDFAERVSWINDGTGRGYCGHNLEAYRALNAKKIKEEWESED